MSHLLGNLLDPKSSRPSPHASPKGDHPGLTYENDDCRLVIENASEAFFEEILTL